MIRIIISIVAIMIFGSTMAHAETPWVNWGSAPYAQNQTEAERLLPRALADLGIPVEFHSEFISLVSTTPGEEIFLDPGDRLIAMMSGGVNPHAMMDVPVAAIPVNKSGSVVQAAKARKWEIRRDEIVHVLILPEICFNWSYMVRVVEIERVPFEVKVEVPAELPPPEECAMIVFPAPVGWHVRQFLLAEDTDRLPISDCYATIDGLDLDQAHISHQPSPCDTCDLTRYLRWARKHGVRGQPINRIRYESKYGSLHAMLIPVSQADNFNVICIDKDADRHVLAPVTVEPSDWKLLDVPALLKLSGRRDIVITKRFDIAATDFGPATSRRW